ncbi:MAG: cisplatin damage response ATP-dependent DNA ligase, partial [Bacteroidota bacterium]
RLIWWPSARSARVSSATFSGEELVTEKYPEIVEFALQLPNGTALDGEIVVHNGEQVLPFSLLQKRIGRKTVGKKILADAPIKFIAYDILECDTEDIRTHPQDKRRTQLEEIQEATNHPNFLISHLLIKGTWQEYQELREKSRQHYAEGFMLKRKSSNYQMGRKRGDWWKWKVDPLTIDAVLIYAMRGHGRRANLFTDYTFAVWNGDQLVPFAKAYSGLTDAEFKEVDKFVKKNTIEKFGPVRSVTPELVFELAFEGIAESTRHKSGIALRFPRMHRWRKDKPANEANTLADLKGLLNEYGT